MSPAMDHLSTLLAPAVCCILLSPCTKAVDFEKSIQPILKLHCYTCHSEDAEEGIVRLDRLDPDLVNGKDAGFWHEALNQINESRMPPAGETQLTKQELYILTDWLEGELEKASQYRLNTGSRQTMRRMTRYEFQYTLEDLLGIELDYTEHLPDDLAGPNGLKTNGSLLGVSPVLMESYLKVANMALEEAIPDVERPTNREKQTDLQITTIRGQRKRTNLSKEQLDVAGVKAKSNLIAPTYDYKTTAFDHDLPRKVTFVKRPFSGRFTIRIELRAIASTTGRLPELTVMIGHRASGDYTPKKVLGQQLVSPSKAPVIVEFSGNIEDFPLGDRQGYYNGSGSHDVTHMAVWIWNTATPQKKYAPDTSLNDVDEPMLDIVSIELEGPLYDGYPSQIARDLIPGTIDEFDETHLASETFRSFLPRAFRREITDSDLQKHMQLFRDYRKITGSFKAAIRNTLATALLSPEFIFLIEPASTDAVPRPLTSYELASRLSYFLWASKPDDELLSIASTGALLQPEILANQVERMRNDPKFERFTHHFTRQWLGLEAMEHVAVNPETYPAFTDQIRNLLAKETTAFATHIFTQDLSLTNFVQSDFVLLNNHLADHYGIDGVEGSHFRAVNITGSDKRGGVLTQGAISLLGSDGTESNPIYRGVWLKRNLFADPPPPPPPGAPPLDATTAAKLTLKQQIEHHRRANACARCHNQIDPWGIAFEEFDAIGRLKEDTTNETKQLFDAASTLPDGTNITGIKGLQTYLLNDQIDTLADAIARRMSEYALGRSLDFSDEKWIEQITDRLVQQELHPSILIKDIVTSNTFRAK